jgi:urease accessory protein
MNRVLQRNILCLIALAMSSPAGAHAIAGGTGGFSSGFMHPLGGLDHLLAMAGVGMWGAFLGRPLIWTLPVAFPLMMVVGGVFGIMGLPVSTSLVECGIASSVLVLGAAIAAAWRAPTILAVGIISVFALFHGYAHGRELPNAAAPELYAAGFVVATGLVHLVGILIGLIAESAACARMLRILGGAIAAAGVWMMLSALQHA